MVMSVPKESTELHVECYAGYKAEQEPRVLVFGDTRRRVIEIVDRWHDPDASYFKVNAEDGHSYLLRYDSREDTWSIVHIFRADA